VTIPLTLDRVGCARVLAHLARSSHSEAPRLYNRLASAWGQRPDRMRVTLKINQEETACLNSLGPRSGTGQLGMVKCGWLVTYRHPKKHHLEVLVYSPTKPPKRRTFTVGGSKRRLVAVSAERINKEAVPAMAKTRSRTRKAPEVDEDLDDELEGLEDELEDLDLEDEEDLDDEPEDEDEDEEEAPPKRRGGARAKKAAPAKSRSRKKVVEEDDEDDEEEEDEEPPRKRGRTRQSSAKTKAKSSTAKKSGKRQPPPQKPLPAGRYSPQDIADEAGTSARAVRVFLRAHEDDFPKDEESFRYSFTKKDVQRIIRAMKRGE
jgi:hypothetical protein